MITRSPTFTLRDRPANGLDDADRLVAHALAGFGALHGAVGPQVAAADARAGHADDRIGGLDNGCVRNVLDPDIAGRVHDGCAHELPPLSIRIAASDLPHRLDRQLQRATDFQRVDTRLDPSQAYEPAGKRLVPIEDRDVPPRRVIRDVAR